MGRIRGKKIKMKMVYLYFNFKKHTKKNKNTTKTLSNIAKCPPNRDKHFSIPSKHWLGDCALGVARSLEDLENLHGISIHICLMNFLVILCSCLHILDSL